ncbi:MAG: hydroxymethylglutaryl-CoA reductase, degradative, partial [Nannocystaceae bacterium]
PKASIGVPPVLDSGRFTQGNRKLGLGSSAAVTVATVGYHLVAAGYELSDPGTRDLVHQLAQQAHRDAQDGRGSGADVAVSTLGGTIAFRREGSTPHFSAAPLPNWLHIGFFDAGEPASTTAFVRAVEQAPDREAIDRAIAQLKQASAEFRSALAGNGEFAKLAQAVHTHNLGLRGLEVASDTTILTPTITRIIATAAKHGLAAKPSGAGGGDLVVVFAPSRGALDRVAVELFHDYAVMPLTQLEVSPQGVAREQKPPACSRLAGFFKLSVEDRRQAVAQSTGIDPGRLLPLDTGSLSLERANHIIENVVGTLDLPVGIATNFRIAGVDYLIPMCVEESSVVAAASNAAKMIRSGGGFMAHSDPPWMIGQIQLSPPAGGGALPAALALEKLLAVKQELLALADTAHPRLVARGGGARDIEGRVLAEDMIVLHVIIDCRDAMGANLVNTVAEILARKLATMTKWVPGLRILSNLSDRRCAHVLARVPPRALASKGWQGEEVVDRIALASRFAELDPYRAATHNKGIMNGVDAVALATGNDWRALEAGAHAYAARSGVYRPLAVWKKSENGWLEGKMSLPAAVGMVGGATKAHPVARLALEILGCRTGAALGQVMAAVGLASNLAALRALATEGIQRGHMSLHARTVAFEAGAVGEEVEQLALELIRSGEIKVEHACTLLSQLRGESAKKTHATGTQRDPKGE